MINASICTIGDEILIGQIVDTNSSRIAVSLENIGVKVTRMVSIGDSREEIITVLSDELKRNDIVVVTGGLGPTKDDITKSAIAELSGSRGYYEHGEQLEIIRTILHSRGLDMLECNKAQALVPDACEVIVNKIGTAPIMVYRSDDGRFVHKCVLYSMPGVPFETEGALPDVIKDICNNFSLSDIYHKTIMTFGLAESALAEKIAQWENALPSDMHLAYLPNPITGVRLRLSTYRGERHEQEDRIASEMSKLKPILGNLIYSENDDTLQNTIGRLLKASGKTLSAAESCTGGLISSLITSVAGASEYYLGSVTSYSNDVKHNVLGVPEEIIAQYGAVSSQCVEKMAEGVRRITGSDFSVATSGIAGPGGGSAEKPVGLAWIGVCTPKCTSSFAVRFKGDRKRNVERFASSALNYLRLAIEQDA